LFSEIGTFRESPAIGHLSRKPAETASMRAPTIS